MKNAGFSLVEVMVVCAILGVVALGISQMMIGQARQQANIQRKANFQQLVMATQAAAASPSAILQSSKGQITVTVEKCGLITCPVSQPHCINPVTGQCGK